MKDTFICSYCHTEHPASEAAVFDVHELCSDCLSEQAVLCYDCGRQIWLSNVGYVVIDECHVFTADATFNENCDWYLKLITERFRHACRICMSGTVDDVLVPLAQAEAEDFRYNVFPPQWQPPREFLWYYQSANFDAYRLEFVDDFDSLPTLINSKKPEKCIVFADSKEKGQALARKLDSAWYVDASRKKGKQWELLVNKERFEEDVMVTTAVLDSGVNIDDAAVKNIVIAADNPTALIQILGRRRIKGNETLNIYVVDMKTGKNSSACSVVKSFWGGTTVSMLHSIRI